MKKIASVILLCGILQYGIAQQLSTITGTVADEDGNRLPFVNIYLAKSVDGGNTDANGIFSFSTKKTGPVELIASLIGFQKFSQQLVLEQGKAISLKYNYKRPQSIKTRWLLPQALTEAKKIKEW